jgi:acetyl-CoA carboxylase carboxyltransferase component
VDELENVAKRVRVARELTLAPDDRAAARLAAQNKLYVRDRVGLLFDDGSFVEDGQLANALRAGVWPTGPGGRQ